LKEGVHWFKYEGEGKQNQASPYLLREVLRKREEQGPEGEERFCAKGCWLPGKRDETSSLVQRKSAPRGLAKRDKERVSEGKMEEGFLASQREGGRERETIEQHSKKISRDG